MLTAVDVAAICARVRSYMRRPVCIDAPDPGAAEAVYDAAIALGLNPPRTGWQPDGPATLEQLAARVLGARYLRVQRQRGTAHTISAADTTRTVCRKEITHLWVAAAADEQDCSTCARMLMSGTAEGAVVVEVSSEPPPRLLPLGCSPTITGERTP
jgi:hypothetical protein